MSPPQRTPPAPGQESVWDYPRPPRLEATSKRLQVIFNGQTIADTTRGYRLLETSHPPTYYIPPEDVQMQFLHRTGHSSICEWKGQAGYYSVVVGEKTAVNAVWFYATPQPTYAAIQNHLCFYAQPMDACYVAGELVVPQPGDFYGGWITKDICGPFKGEEGSWWW
jgi:uncharacterized protein (DUF427 family)